MPFDCPFFIDRNDIADQFASIRGASLSLAEALTPEDWMLQSMPSASPVKWNLAHTSWFFETFILKPFDPDYCDYHPKFGYLFNSYYNQIGAMHPRDTRGMISRPGAQEVRAYRAHVDGAMEALIARCSDESVARIAELLALGLAHEQQHQELLLTDLKHAMNMNPLSPAVYEDASMASGGPAEPLRWEAMEGGLCSIGATGEGFSFDNEGPRHQVFLQPFELAHRAITNGEFAEFIEDGAYQNPNLWLADAWEMICAEKWRAPLYWRHQDGQWTEYTLFGARAIDPAAPVCHISFYEAAAFAGWAGARLPTEFEWEAAASLFPLEGNFMESGAPRSPEPAANGERLAQLYGDVWEWTASPYIAYPGFSAAPDAIGEYNGKFMSGQMVLRGGSCATPTGHLRLGYRNFFPPEARWQFAGARLARDCS